MPDDSDKFRDGEGKQRAKPICAKPLWAAGEWLGLVDKL